MAGWRAWWGYGFDEPPSLKAENQEPIMNLATLSVTAPVLAAAAAVPVTTAAPTVWEIDTAHASAGFKVRHLMVSHVRGQLGPVTGTLWLDENRVESCRIEVSIDSRKIE